MEDSLPKVSAEVDLRVRESVRSMNQTGARECDWDRFTDEVGSRLRRPVYGQIEYFIKHASGLARSEIEFERSVYQHLPLPSFAAILAGTVIGIGFAPAIHHDGLSIGADKFGHFMDEGYFYYLIVHRAGRPVDDALKFGIKTEETFNGLWTSGIFSHADLAANYDGLQFWTDVLGTPTDRARSKYVGCSAGVWASKMAVDLAPYVSPAWDEAINCNRYRSAAIEMAVDRSLRELEARERRNFHCPVAPDRIAEMIVHYGAAAMQIIHADVLQRMK